MVFPNESPYVVAFLEFIHEIVEALDLTEHDIIIFAALVGVLVATWSFWLNRRRIRLEEKAMREEREVERIKKEEVAKLKKAEEERLKREEEARIKTEEEERLKREEEERLKREEEVAKLKKAEEARLKREEEVAKLKKAEGEEEARLKREEEERLKRREEARLKREAEERLKREDEERLKREEEEEEKLNQVLARKRRLSKERQFIDGFEKDLLNRVKNKPPPFISSITTESSPDTQKAELKSETPPLTQNHFAISPMPEISDQTPPSSPDKSNQESPESRRRRLDFARVKQQKFEKKYLLSGELPSQHT